MSPAKPRATYDELDRLRHLGLIARRAEKAMLDGERRSPGVAAMRELRAAFQSASVAFDDALDSLSGKEDQ